MASERFERALEVALIDLAQPSVPDYLTDILGQTADTRQRPAWASIERWLPMDITTRPLLRSTIPWRQLAIIAALIALVAGAAALYVGTHQTRLPAPFGPAANGVIPYESNGDLYIGDPVTGQTHPIVTGPEHDWGPSFSYDGTLIGFLRDVVTPSGVTAQDVYVVRADGSGLRRITTQPIVNRGWAQWTPDGRIGVIHQEPSEDVPGCATTICPLNQLDMFSVDGSGKVERIAGAVRADELQFRPPDGREILYRAFVDDKEGLYSMAPDGTGSRLLVASLTTGENDLDLGGFTYSSDGDRIFYQRVDPALAPDLCCRLWVMNADGSDAHEFRPPGGPAWDGQAVVSPDGARVAYWHGANGGPPTHGITVVRSDGTGPVIEAGPKLSGTAHWVWSPDSSHILLYPDDGSSPNAYLVDPNGGPSSTVPWASGPDLDWQRLALP